MNHGDRRRTLLDGQCTEDSARPQSSFLSCAIRICLLDAAVVARPDDGLDGRADGSPRRSSLDEEDELAFLNHLAVLVGDAAIPDDLAALAPAAQRLFDD